MSYTKLFKSILTSTIWSEDDRTRIVWITMLACSDKNGEIQASIPGLARIAGVPVEDCRAAIGKFLSPDPDSRTSDEGGRRIEKIDGGWALLNFVKYRDMASKEDSRITATLRKARWRARQNNVTECHCDVTGMSPPPPSPSSPHTPLLPHSPPHSEAEGEYVTKCHGDVTGVSTSEKTPPPISESGKRMLNHPPLEKCQDHFKKCSDYTGEQVRQAFQQFEASTCDGEWMWGKRPVTDWRSAMESRMSDNRARSDRIVSAPGGRSPKTAAQAMSDDLERLVNQANRAVGKT